MKIIDDPVDDTAAEAEAELIRQAVNSSPPYRDWRWTSRARNSGTIRSLPATKFPPERIAELVQWVGGRGLSVLSQSPTMIEVSAPPNETLDLSQFGVEGVKAERARELRAARKERDAKIASEKEASAESRESRKWIVATFGADAMNAHNSNALSDFLEGKTKRFEGRASPKWREGMERLRVLSGSSQGEKVDWEAVRAAYQHAPALRD